MGAFHYLQLYIFGMTEMLQRRHQQHRLLIAVFHILIGHDHQHRRVGFICADIVKGRSFVHVHPAAVNAPLPQHIEMGGGLTGIVDKAGNVRRCDAVFCQVVLIKAEHLGNIAAGGAAAHIDAGNLAVGFHIFKDPGGSAGCILQEFRVFGGRVHSVVGADHRNTVGCQILNKHLHATGLIAVLNATAVEIQKHREAVAFRQVNI